MNILIGKVIAKFEGIAPKTVFRIRCNIADGILCMHTETQFEKMSVLTKMNKFLQTMSESNRGLVMANIGVKPAPKWAARNPVVHMGEE